MSHSSWQLLLFIAGSIFFFISWLVATYFPYLMACVSPLLILFFIMVFAIGALFAPSTSRWDE